MWSSLRALSPGLVLIAVASGVLLLSDLGHRAPAQRTAIPLAIVQHASVPALDDGVEGMLDGLAEKGFVDGHGLAVSRFNAENDLPTANTIAKSLTDGRFRMILTASTLSLQTVAAANREGKSIHVFGLVADPFVTGVGISRDNPLAHPKHLAGYGTFLPVADAFGMAKQFYPGLRRVGLVWNATEANSEAYTRKAREVSRELDLQLLEANAENSASVGDAVRAVISRGAQVLWISGDVTVNAAADVVLSEADKAHIPVFSNLPSLVEKGALFSMGADFREVGRLTGLLAAEILHGKDPATVPVENIVPRTIAVNRRAVATLREPWRIPAELLTVADVVVDEAGVQRRKVAAPVARPASRQFTIGVVYFGPDPVTESGLQGFLDRLTELGFVEGQNLTVRKAHAQGDISLIPAIMQNYLSQDLDLIVPLTTPCLAAAAALVKTTPVVFTVVYDPIAAGAGTSRTDHLPNVTGVGSFPPVDDTVAVLKQLVPSVRTVGTVYNAAEANSRKVIGVARDLFKKQGISLEEVTVANTGEIFQAAQSLAVRDIQALWITGDNTVLQGFDGVVKVARDAKLPLVINDPEFVQPGVVAAVGLGFYEAGRAAGDLAAQVLHGKSPAHVPFGEVAIKRIVFHGETAKKLGIALPPAEAQHSQHRADPPGS